MREKYQKIYQNIVFYYTLAFAIYTLFGRFTILHALVENTVNAFLFVFAGFFGLFLFSIDFFFYRNYQKMKCYPVYAVFILCAAISSALNYQYGITSNLSTLVWLVVQMGLFATMGQLFTRQQYHRWLTLFFTFSGLIWGIASAVSVWQYIFVPGYRIAMNGRLIRQSLYDNRLFGVFIDPNLGAFVAFLVIWGMVYLMRRFSSRILRAIAAANCLVQLIYIILSGSRSTEVCMICSLSYTVILLLIKYFKKRKKQPALLIRAASYILAPILCTLVMAGSFHLFKTGVSHLASVMAPEKHISKEELKRTDIEGNESNNRIDIWKGYLFLMKDKPLFGVSPRNAWNYADREHPGSYIAEHHYDVHNAYVAVLACMGAAGFLVLLVMIFCFLKTLLPRSVDTGRMDLQYFTALQIILNVSVFIFFYPGIFFTNGIDTVLFWPAIGYTMQQAGTLLPSRKPSAPAADDNLV